MLLLKLQPLSLFNQGGRGCSHS